MQAINLRARWIFPVAAAPIADGLITITGDRIARVGNSDGRAAENLGNVAILPGLVNVHTHLDLSDLPVPLGQPGIGFADWIRQVIGYRRRAAGAGRGLSQLLWHEATKMGLSPSAPLSAVERGLEESARLGTTALGDIAQPDITATGSRKTGTGSVAHGGAASAETLPPRCLSPFSAAASRGPVEQGDRHRRRRPNIEARLCRGDGASPLFQLSAAALAGTIFFELIAPTHARIAPALELAREHVQASAACGGPAWRRGLSPHAPYSVHWELLSAVAALSAAEGVPLAMHLAESREELQLLQSHDGPLRELLEELDCWEPAAILPAARPLDYLRALASARQALVIHGNYLDDEEIAFLAAHRERLSVAYCPRTHALFGHAAYPLEKMLDAGVSVALGTDSRASSPDLSVLAEMRSVARRHPAVARDAVLRLGTICGARALGREREIGGLEPGKYADLAIVALPDRETADPHELLLESTLPVVATWHHGKQIFPFSVPSPSGEFSVPSPSG